MYVCVCVWCNMYVSGAICMCVCLVQYLCVCLVQYVCVCVWCNMYVCGAINYVADATTNRHGKHNMRAVAEAMY